MESLSYGILSAYDFLCTRPPDVPITGEQKYIFSVGRHKVCGKKMIEVSSQGGTKTELTALVTSRSLTSILNAAELTVLVQQEMTGEKKQKSRDAELKKKGRVQNRNQSRIAT